MTLKKILFTAALGLTLTSIAQTSLAQDETAPYPPFEGNGLYDAGHRNNLGAGIFHQSKRSEIIALIKNASKSEWRSLDNLIINTLLTTTELSTLHNDIPLTNGNDLFTVRLNKLLDLGYYKKAYELYSTIKDAEINSETSKAGVLSMLYNGQRGKACLEVKISLPKYPDNLFWREMNAYCTLSHTEEVNSDQWAVIQDMGSDVITNLLKDKSYKISYSQNILSSYTPLELALATSQHAIDISEIPYDQYSQITEKHIEILLLNPALSAENRIILSGYAALYGIINANTLDTLFIEALEKNQKDKQSGILGILPLYDDVKSAILGGTRAKKINQAFDLADTYGDGILIPFIPHIAKLDADDLTTSRVKRALHLFITVNANIPTNWLSDLLDITPENDTDKQALSNIIFVLKTISESVDKDDIEGSQNTINAYLLSNAKASGINYIIENIDSAENNGDKVFNIYENGFDLAAKKSYTMPPPVIINELKRSSKNQNIAQTVLLAGIIANRNSKSNVHLEVLEQTLNALVQTGFEKQARQILAQAILEID